MQQQLSGLRMYVHIYVRTRTHVCLHQHANTHILIHVHIVIKGKYWQELILQAFRFIFGSTCSVRHCWSSSHHFFCELKLFHLFIYGFCGAYGIGVPFTLVLLWKSEDRFQEPRLSFHHVCPGMGLTLSRLSVGALTSEPWESTLLLWFQRENYTPVKMTVSKNTITFSNEAG